jgi:hypothetical protein
MGAREASIAVRESAFNGRDKERRVETVSQQGLARFAPPDSSAAQGASRCCKYARGYDCSRDYRAVLQFPARLLLGRQRLFLR